MAVSTIKVARNTLISDGSGIGGSSYINAFDIRRVIICGHACCVIVTCTTAAIPAWTQFLTIASDFRNPNMAHMRIAACKNQSSDFVGIVVRPHDGYIGTMQDAIPSGTLLSFYVTYPLL